MHVVDLYLRKYSEVNLGSYFWITSKSSILDVGLRFAPFYWSRRKHLSPNLYSLFPIHKCNFTCVLHICRVQNNEWKSWSLYLILHLFSPLVLSFAHSLYPFVFCHSQNSILNYFSAPYLLQLYFLTAFQRSEFTEHGFGSFLMLVSSRICLKNCLF